jgi:RNA polymerase sigma-70 factor (ECF subfamily)
MPLPAPRIRQLVATGDTRAAATEAIRLLGPQVLRYLRSILHDEDDVEDAFSTFAEAVWRGLPGFRWESSLRTWSFRLAWHAALTVRSEAWRRRRRHLATSEASKIADEVRTKSFIRVERQRKTVERLVAALPVEDQSLFALRVGQGLSWREIAEVLATEEQLIDASALAKRFSRLKEHLGQLARDQGLLDE